MSESLQDKDLITAEKISSEESYGTFNLENENLRKKVFNAVMDRLNSVKPQHDAQVEKWELWEKMYQSSYVAQDKQTLATINTGMMWNSVEDWVAVIMDAVFSVQPIFDVKPSPNKVKAPPIVYEKIKSALWSDSIATSLEDNSEIGIRYGVMFGNFTFKKCVQLDEDKRIVRKQRPAMFNIGNYSMPIPGRSEQYMEYEVNNIERTALKPVDPRNLYFRSDKVSWIIEKSVLPWDVIKNQAREYQLYGNIEKAMETTLPDQIQTANIQTSSSAGSATKEQNKNIFQLDGEVEILEAHHIPLKLSEDDGVPPEYANRKILCIVTIANQKEVIRIQPTPYDEPPYIISPFVPRRNSSYGIGVCEMLEQSTREFNTRRNQALDLNTLGLYAMIVANPKYLKDPSQLKIRPHGRIDLKNCDPTSAGKVVDFIRPPMEAANTAMQHCAAIQEEAQRNSRLKSVMSGNMTTPITSATEVSYMMKEAIKSVRMIFRRIDRNIYAKYFQFAYEMALFHRKAPWLTDVRDPFTGQIVFNEVSVEDIYTDGIDIEIVGFTRLEDDIISKNQDMQIMDLAMKVFSAPVPNEYGQLVLPNTYKMFNDIMIKSGKENPQDYWVVLPGQQMAPGTANPNAMAETKNPNHAFTAPNSPSGPDAVTGGSMPTFENVAKGTVESATPTGGNT